MLLFSVINVMGVKWLAETNKAAVWWTIAIPVVTVVALALSAFHTGNFSADGGFMPFGSKGVFTAVASGGVIFAYLGFERAIQLGRETRRPRRDIPLGVIGSMALGVVLYILLQVVFLGALDPASLAHGWTDVTFTGHGAIYGPFAGLAASLGLGWLATLLYIDAAISPGGTGLLYLGTSSRVSFALARNRYIPRPLSARSARGVPLAAIALSPDRVVRRELARPVPRRAGRHLVPGLLRHGGEDLVPRPARARRRPPVRLGRPRHGGLQPVRLRRGSRLRLPRRETEERVGDAEAEAEEVDTVLAVA